MTYKTGKKEKIIEFLRENEDMSFSLDEICDAIVGNCGGRSTVYRLVGELVREGTVRPISDAKSRHRTYQAVSGDHCHEHLHLKCVGCGRLLHLDEKTSQVFEDRLKNEFNFELDGEAMLFGKCEGCRVGGENA